MNIALYETFMRDLCNFCKANRICTMVHSYFHISFFLLFTKNMKTFPKIQIDKGAFSLQNKDELLVVSHRYRYCRDVPCTMKGNVLWHYRSNKLHYSASRLQCIDKQSYKWLDLYQMTCKCDCTPAKKQDNAEMSKTTVCNEFFMIFALSSPNSQRKSNLFEYTLFYFVYHS